MRNKIVTAAVLSLFMLAAIAAPIAPFNAHNSTQVFQKNQSGGFQQVTAKDPDDKVLVGAIRSYLEAQAERFGNGDYSGRFKGVRHLKAVKPPRSTSSIAMCRPARP